MRIAPGMRRYARLFVDAVAREIAELRALLERPLVAPLRSNRSRNASYIGKQVRDVVDEILELPLRKRPRRPVADRLRFRQAHVLQVAHEIGERDLHAVTRETRPRFAYRRRSPEPSRSDRQKSSGRTRARVPTTVVSTSRTTSGTQSRRRQADRRSPRRRRTRAARPSTAARSVRSA